MVHTALTIMTWCICTKISILLEISIGLIRTHGIKLRDHLITLRHMSLPLFKTLSLVKTIDFVCYLLRFDLSKCIYFDLEELHPTYSSYWVLS